MMVGAAIRAGARSVTFSAGRSLRTVGVQSRTNALAGSIVSRRCMSTFFAESHEYVKVEGNVGTVGITDFAADALGDIVFVDLPEVGDSFEAGDSFGSVESVKAASDVYVPVGGEVVEINEALEAEPGMVNQKALSDGWFIKIKSDSLSSDTSSLMDEKAYGAHIEKDN